jgi:hypothetical protein
MHFPPVHQWRTHKITSPSATKSGNVNDNDVGHEYTTEMVSLEDLLYIRIVAYCI